MLSFNSTKDELIGRAQLIRTSIGFTSNPLGGDSDIEKIRENMRDLAELVEAVCRLLPEDRSER